MKIRRNATTKIAGIARKAISIRAHDHSGPEGPKPVDLDRTEAILSDWFAWAAGRGSGPTWCGADLSENTQRYVDGVLHVQTVLQLTYHSNRSVEFILSSEPVAELIER